MQGVMDHSKRKLEHIELTTKSQSTQIDNRFNYEPLFGDFSKKDLSTNFLGKKLAHPLWVSSMTGGTGKARHINQNLAKLVGDFSLGMGLGSLRVLLDSQEDLDDFDLRSLVKDQLLMGNIGIIQLQDLLKNSKIDNLYALVDKLKLDGIFIHINPMQEFMQPEGDFFHVPAI